MNSLLNRTEFRHILFAFLATAESSGKHVRHTANANMSLNMVVTTELEKLS